MADINANAGTGRKYSMGSVVEITRDQDSQKFIMKHLSPGEEVSVVQGGYEKIEQRHDGAIVDDVEGDENPSFLDFVAVATGGYDAGGDEFPQFLEASAANANDEGKGPYFTIVVKEPDYKGASTGTQETWTKCTLVAGSLRKSSGGPGEFAKHSFQMKSHDPKPARATY